MWFGRKTRSMANVPHEDIVEEKGDKTTPGDRDRGNSSSDQSVDRDPEAGVTPPAPHYDGRTTSPVDFDQPFDPADPLHWSERKKLSIVVNISLLSAAGQMASSILAPSALQILADLDPTASLTLAVLVVSSFQLGTAAGLLLTSGASEAYGRVPVLHATNALSVALACASATAPSLPTLVVLRLLHGAAAAAPPAVGGGAIGDMFAPRDRGRATGVYGLGMLLGPAVGPVVGGYVARRGGWRWSCWAVAMAAGALAVGSVVVLRESCRPVLLDRRARRLRAEAGGDAGGLVAAVPRGQERSSGWVAGLRTSVVRPVGLLLTSPLVFLPALGLAVIFGIMFLVLSTMSTIYQQVYGWDTGASGLPYLGLGVGLLLGLGIYSATVDRVYRRLAETVELTPEMRLAPITLGAPLAAIGLVIYGWAFEKQLHWMVPIVGCIIFCQGMVAFMMPVTTYLIDAFHMGAAGPVGAASVLRCLAGGLLPLCADKLYLRLGYGWGNTMLAFIVLAFAPFPYLFYKNGEKLRKRFLIKDCS